MIVDYSRLSYTRLMRVFSDSAETVRVRWYPARPDAKCLPVPTALNMNIWYADPWTLTGPGEVWEDHPKFDKLDTPPSATGQHPCSPDPTWWQTGEPYRPDDPPAARDPFGLLTCCNEEFVYLWADLGLEPYVVPPPYEYLFADLGLEPYVAPPL